MKKFLLFIIFYFAVNSLFGQSTLTIGIGSSVSVGSGSDVAATNRDGTMMSSGTFNSRSIVFNPVAIAATSISSSNFTANWNASSGANGYKLDVSTDANFGSFITGYQNLDVGSVTTYNVSSGLSSGTTYYYRVRAYDIDGITGYSNVITLVTAPVAPVASAATSINEFSFYANWGTVTGATKYYIDIATDNGFTSMVTGWSDVNVGNVATYSISTNLTAGTTYYYRVRAANAYGTSSSSNTITVLTAPPVPVAAAATSLTQTSFSANWGASAGATKYYLDVSVNASFLAGQFVSGYQNLDVSNVTTYSVNTNLAAGTIYYYRVRSNNGAGTSTNSNVITLSTVPPNPVASAASAISQSSFTANWGASTNAASYYLDVATDNAFTLPVGTWTDVPVGNVTTYVVNTGLTAGTTYYYRVRAANPSGTSGNSNVVNLTLVPPEPTTIAATGATQTSFSANWNAALGAAGYRLDVSASNTFSSFITGWNNVDVNNVNTYSVNSGLTAGTTYYYRVRAYNANGTSASSNVTSIVLVPPAPVTIAATNVATTSFTAGWNASTGATGYYLDVATDNAFTAPVAGWTNVDVGNNTTHLVNSGLTAGTTYYYRVRANNSSGLSGDSDVRTVLTAPGTPNAIASSNQTLSSFSANWDAMGGASGYYLDVATDVNFTAGTFVVGYQNLDVTNVLTYSVNSNLTAGTTYYYRVRSYNSGGTSLISNTITTATTPNSPIASAATSISSTGFHANWNSITGASGYRLDVSTDAAFGAGNFVTGYNNLDVNNVYTYSVTGLAANTTYYYRIKAYNSYSTGSPSGTITTLTAPDAPVSASPTYSSASDNFTANWAASAGATGYYLDVSTINDFSSFITGYQSADVGTATSRSVSGLTAGTTYYYRVRAFNSGGISPNSLTQTAVTIPLVPTAAPATSILDVSFAANWGTVSGATGYRLDVSTDLSFGAGNFVTGYNDLNVNNVLTYSVSGLTAGNTYYFRVRSYNASGTGNSSNIITVTTKPAAPVEQAATSITNSGFTANWALSTGATGYKLDVSTDAAFGAGNFVTGYNDLDVGNVLTYSITGLTAGTTYHYRIRAYNTAGTSGNSGTISPATTGLAPRAPASSPATSIAATGFSANWVASSGATKYYLDVSTDAAFGAGNFVTGYNNLDVSNVLTYSVSSLTAGTVYYYRVRAYNANGTSGNSSVVSLVTLPAKTTGLASSSILNNGFSVTWNSMTGATGYKIDVSTATDFSAPIAPYNNLDIASVTTYSVIGLTANTTYYCRVKAYNTGGDGTPADYVTVLTTNAAGTFYANPATAITGTGFTANWTTHASATKYLLDVATDNGFTSFVTGYSDLDMALATSSPVTGLTAGQTYYYRVKAYDAVPTLLATSGTVTVLTIPAAPTTNAASSNTETSFTASWNASTGATGYYLDVATDAGFSSFVTGFNDKYVNSATSYAITGLTAGTTYYYHVRAKNGSGISASSGSSSTSTIPKEPTPTAASSILSTSFDANWSASTGATGYRIDVASDAGFTSMVTGWSDVDLGSVITKTINTNLTSGTNYYYRIRSYNNGGTSGNSGIISLSTAPAIPTVAAAASIGANSFTANWNPVSGATKYYLDVSTDIAFGTFQAGYQNLDVSNVTTYPVSGLLSNTTYYYRVRSYSSSGTSNSSGNQTVLTLPPAPTVLSATSITTTSFSANWVKVTGATNYYIDVSAAANFSSYVVNNSAAGDNATISINSGLSGSTTYYYRVRSYNATGSSANSEIITLITSPSAPTATAATSLQETNISANWNASASVDGYLLDVSIASDFSSFVTGFNSKDVHNVTTYTVTGLTGGTTYYYRLRSYTGSRISDNSGTITFLTKPSAGVSIAATSVTTTSFAANWNTVTSATKYYLEVATNPGFTTYVTGFSPKDENLLTTQSVTSLSANTNYYYRTAAYNASGTGAVSNIQTVLTAPLAPTANAATSITNISLTANWSASTGATGYYLDVANDAAFTDLILTNVDAGNVISYPVINLNGSHTYYYRVKAYNTGGTSAPSGTITAVTAADPSPAPVSIAASPVTETGFTANWNTVATATGYRLDVASNIGFTNFVTGFQDLDVLNVITHAVTGLTSGTTYYYRVRSYNVSGISSNSNVITVLTIPAAPVSAAASTLAETSFTANWAASTGATKYYLDVATDAAFTSILAAYTNKDVSNVLTYSVTGLTGGNTYYYRVRANNATGTSGNSGPITVLTSPAAPVASAATSVAATSFTANWAASTGATKYYLDVATDAAFTSILAAYNNKDVSNVLTYSVTGLTSNTSYYYRMRAYNATGTSGNSNTITIVGVPTAAAATLMNESGFKANWSLVAGATKYFVDVSTASDFSSFVGSYNNSDAGDASSFTTTGLSANTTYYYRVRANNAGGTSDNSTTITAYTAPPAPVSSAATSITPNSFTANWNSSVGAIGYYLEIATDNGFTSSTIDTLGAVTSYIVSGIERGTTYYYRVRARNAHAASSNSSIISILAAPLTSVATDIMQTSFTANWNTVSSATKYYLDVATNNGFTTFVPGYQNKDVGNVLFASVTGLVKNTDYYYRVRSYDGSITSPNSEMVATKTLPDAPTAAAATSITQTSFSANWTIPGSGFSGFKIDVATDIAFTNLVAGYDNQSTGYVNTFPVTGLSAGQTYYYRLRATNSWGSSDNSNIITVILTPKTPVANASTGITTNSFILNWSAATGATGYRIDIASDSLFATMSVNNKDVGTALAYSLQNLPSNSTYYSRVRAYNVTGTSGNSNRITTTTLAEKPALSKFESAILNYTVKQAELIITDSLSVQCPSTSPVQIAEIKISKNYVRNEDQLTFQNSSGISGSWDGENGKLILTNGGGTVDYQHAIRTVKYINNALQPSSFNKEITITVNNGFFTSDPVVRSLNVKEGNTPPVFTKLESTKLVYLKGVSGLRIPLTDSLVVTDADNMYLYGATVKILSGYFRDEDYLDFNNTTFITGSFNVTNGILTITGKATVQNYQDFIRSLTYRNSSGANGTSSKKVLEFTVNDGLVNSTSALRQFEIKSPLETPTELKGAITSNKVELTWNDTNKGEDGYIIERSDNNNTLYIEIARTDSNIVKYSDVTIKNGIKYFYRVAAYKSKLKSDCSNEVSVTGIVVGISDQQGIPKEYIISQNYPNPFNPTTTIIYGLPQESRVRIEIYNILGQLVDVLVSETKSPGYYKTNWNAGRFSSGVYIYRVYATPINGTSHFIEAKRMILVK